MLPKITRNYALPNIGPSWYTPDLQRELLKKVQYAFGLPQNGIYDDALAEQVKGVQQKLGMTPTGMIDNNFLIAVGISPVEADPGWQEGT